MAQLPLQMNTSTKFGRYPKMSSEQVYNMFSSDSWMINVAGYENVKSLLGGMPGRGRGIFYSSRKDALFIVANQKAYVVTAVGFVLTSTIIGSLGTATGDVYIDENLKGQVAFCDGQAIYIYDYNYGAFQRLSLDFTPGYVAFQDDRFIASCTGLPQWRLSDFNLLTIATAVVANGGAGYGNGDVLTVLIGDGGKLTVTGNAAGVITTVAITVSGAGYSDGVYAVSGGTGAGATFNITVASGFTAGAGQTGSFQTKPDNVKACVRMPGKTGQLLIMGERVTEVWSDLGLQIFPYQRNSSYNIDYGCLNPATIGSGDDFIVWIGANEKSGPVIMCCSGSGINQISTDGINFRLSELNYPEQSFGFVFKQDGHMFYQITFSHASDNVSYIYDFNTEKFYTLTDINQNYHIARRVAFFNNSYFFVSAKDTNLYRLDSNITTHDGHEIPRIIITAGSGLPDRRPFVVNNLTFPIEQGENVLPARVDLSTSSDGGATFGDEHGIYLNAFANRRNILKFYNLGRYNEVTFQFKFWSFNRFVLCDGVAEIT